MSAEIRIDNYSYSYPDGIRALREVTLEIPAREKVALIGPNGAGKTTLLLSLVGICRGEGDLQVCGIDLSKKTLRDIRSKTGFLFQDPDDQLFSPTVIEDVAFAPLNMGMDKEDALSAARNALVKVNLPGFEDRLPSSLSYGEKKRAALATVLSYSPSVYLFDEPTANLDPKNRRSLINFMKSLENTVLFATHDLDLAYETANRIVLLNKGEVAAEGKVKEILEDESLLLKNDLELPLFVQGRQFSDKNKKK